MRRLLNMECVWSGFMYKYHNIKIENFGPIEVISLGNKFNKIIVNLVKRN